MNWLVLAKVMIFTACSVSLLAIFGGAIGLLWSIFKCREYDFDDSRSILGLFLLIIGVFGAALTGAIIIDLGIHK